MEVNRATLANGLRLVHHYMPDTAMVTLDVIYGVGAVDEHPDMTGIAHLFEHIMFGGSANVPDFDDRLTMAGGVSNAWTSNDYTNFYQIAPAHNAETLFYLESDRMLAPSISLNTLDVQRSVVIEEFKQQCLNVPYGDMMHALRPMVYGTHPYSWPVIGRNIESLERITRDDVVRWWRTHYMPDNAVLAVAGNIGWEDTLRYAVKWFGTIPSRSRTPRAVESVADLAERKTRTVRGSVPATLIVVAYAMDRYGTPSYVAADAITDILAAGRASRFSQRISLNPDSPLVDADASISGARQRGMLMLTARLEDEGCDVEKATDLLIDTARSVITEGVSGHELQRLKNRQRSLFVMSNLSCPTCAQTIAEAEINGMEPTSLLEMYQRLTTDDIVRVARSIFDDSKPAVLYYRPTI